MSTYGTPYIYSDMTPNQHEWNEAADEGKAVECADCSWRGHVDEVKPIKRYHERVDEDDEWRPAGECPECGSLAYTVED